ncbi:MAG: acyl--CoA ligase [Sphingomonadales bacterium]|nr:acyl--CoA ligase [Sphingomonadales bacterium]
MPSELDRRLASIMAQITAPGTAFETGSITRGGVRLPIYSQAPTTLPALFDRYCAEHGHAEFLVDGELRLSFAQTHALARRVAAGLATRHDVRRGDRVGIAARNSANWIIAYMGVLMAGGCVSLLNGWWSGDELAGGIALSDCTLVLADPLRAVRLGQTESAARLVVFDHGEPEHGLAGILGDARGLWRQPELTGDDLATIKFTSGSTGTAKGAVSDHRAVVQATINFAVQGIAAFKVQAGEGAAQPPQSTLLSVPLFHVTGEIALFLQSFVTGRRLVIMPKWDAREAMRLIEQERITFFTGVPLMSVEIASHPERGRYDLSSCAGFAAGGAPRPAEHVGQLREALPHAALFMGYGLTETNCTGSCNIADNYIAKPGSAGPASPPLVEIAILGADGALLPAGLRGEIAVRSICNFRGYWGNPAETEASLRSDGFFLTGDLGYLDDDGYLFIVDRKKDIIIRGGENIASAEVEQAIYSHPGVAEVSVFGLPHAHYGEVPVAVYAAKHGHLLGEEDLLRHLAGRIAAFKVPVRLWREDSALPRLGTEKIDKRSLKARYSQAWEAAKGAL